MDLNKLKSVDKLLWKQELKELCSNIISERLGTAKQAMVSAQESANSEGKSSAGDKHETARAMSQLENEMFSKQFQEASRELELLQRINVDRLLSEVLVGSVVTTESCTYFIASGLGLIKFRNKPVYVVSPKAPILMVMKGKKAGDSFNFNGQQHTIVDIF